MKRYDLDHHGDDFFMSEAADGEYVRYEAALAELREACSLLQEVADYAEVDCTGVLPRIDAWCARIPADDPRCDVCGAALAHRGKERACPQCDQEVVDGWAEEQEQDIDF